MTKNEIDKLYAAATASTQVKEPSFIRASAMELKMYIECRKAGREMPAAGSDEFWKLFDQVDEKSTSMGDCPRSLMERYIKRPPREIKTSPKVANDPAVKELEKILEERRNRNVVMEPLDCDL